MGNKNVSAVKENITKLDCIKNKNFCLLKNIRGGFPGGAAVENPPANAEDTGSGPGLGRSHVQRSKLGPWATIAEPARLEPVLGNKRGHDGERPTHRDEEWPPPATTRESPRTETKTQHSHK